jgi:hypothetical protein
MIAQAARLASRKKQRAISADSSASGPELGPISIPIVMPCACSVEIGINEIRDFAEVGFHDEGLHPRIDTCQKETATIAHLTIGGGKHSVGQPPRLVGQNY